MSPTRTLSVLTAYFVRIQTQIYNVCPNLEEVPAKYLIGKDKVMLKCQ